MSKSNQKAGSMVIFSFYWLCYPIGRVKSLQPHEIYNDEDSHADFLDFKKGINPYRGVFAEILTNNREVKMDRESTRQEIRRLIPCTKYLEKSKNGLYCCPFCGSGHGDHATGAVKYYEDTNTWYCHACRKGGDVIDLYMEITGKDYNTAISELADQLHITIEHSETPRNAATSDFKPQESNNTMRTEKRTESRTEGKTEGLQDFTAYYNACKKRITDPAAVDYLQGRGISMETAIAYNVGYDPAADPLNAPGALEGAPKKYPKPAVIFPSTEQFYEYRLIKRDKYDKKNPAGTSPTLFNSQALYTQEVQEIFVTESIIDALSIIEVGGQAVATSSASNYSVLVDQLKAKPTNAVIIICFDDDDAGRARAKDLQEDLNKLNTCSIMFDNSLFNGTKDANEALKKNRVDFEAAIMSAEYKAKEARRAAEREEQERRKRTGEQMIDEFISIVKTKKYEPIPTGITDIDKAIGGGFIRQQLVLLGAAPALGKTALAQWIFETMATKGHDSLYINLEMSKEQMLARSISRITAYNGKRIKPTDILQGYKWTQEQERAITAAANEYKTKIAPHIIYNPDGITTELDSILEYIEAEARRAEAAQNKAPNVVIDYLQIIRGKEREDDTATIKRAVSSFKDFAVKHNTVVFLIIAHNRAANKTGAITQEAGRDTSALEYSADLQLGLTYTALQTDKGKKREDLTADELNERSLIITKARWGEVHHRADLYFNGETMTFSQIEKRQTPAAIDWSNAK